MKMLTVIIVFLISTSLLILACSPQICSQWQGGRSFPAMNYQNGKFRNLVSTKPSSTDMNMFKATLDFMRGNPDRTPSDTIPAFDISTIGKILNNNDVRVTWLGHSTCLIEIDGKVILTDPMFSDRASPLSFIGPKCFTTDLVFKAQNLPKIDAVLISHDHYDHLDYQTILSLQNRVSRFYVPLGVGDHLKRWGIAKSQIVELDWWEEKTLGSLTFVATPAHHFSGRGMMDRNKTLWASWTILGTRQRVFFGGDSGYFDGFRKIGERYGPFDLTMLESGAYNKAWADIHMFPEETVKAHMDLKGKVLLPIHWAKFNLALHPWDEPIQQLLKKAQEYQVSVTTPQIGKSFHPSDYPRTSWWKLAMHEK